MKHWVLLLILGMVWGHASNGHCAQKVLDIFQARKPFPIGWLAPGGFQDLETLSSGKQREVLAQLDRAGKKRKFRKQRNLIHLTAGRLEALLNEPLASCHRLKYSIVGNFILEDYRLHFLSQCEIALAEKDSAGDKPNHSLSHLRRALQYKMALFKSYPSSPFSHDLADELARVERLAGKANLESGNLKRAWQTYRKALMRTTAGPPDMAIDATLGLAQVYEKAGNYADAIDLHLFLSRNHPTATVREAASGFVERMEQTTGQTKRALDGLDKLAAWASQAAAPFREFSPRPKTFQNPTVQNFWDVFAAGNLDQVLDAAQAVFAEVPGHREAAGVLPALNRFLTEYLQNHEWPEELDEILAHYPVKALGALGFMLWKQQLVEAAANVYRRILQDHPLETEWCHKAAFFLGRIYEDLKDYPAAQDQYQNLLQRYNQGPYTPMARFKVPWVRRLQ
ncbi:MAG: tol-pal system YbgF family protein, partial [Nitrospinaceae bacterium]